MRIELPFGSSPYPLEIGGRDVELVQPAAMPPAPDLDGLLARALDAPLGTGPLAVRAGDRVTVIVSDATRDEPRAAFLAALRARLPGARWTIAIATGTHGAGRVDQLGLPEALLREARIVNHDGHREAGLVELGTTARGTPVRVHRCVLESDLVIATGCIRPHYFAGFGAGVKAIFPGLGEAAAIRINHRLKTEPGARAGVVDGNPCREDLEEAVGLLSTPAFLVNGVCGPDGRIHAVVAGDLRRAFRAGVALARPWFTVRAPRAPVVVASDVLPVTASLYQSAKIAAAVAPLVAGGGTLVIVAECRDGIEPLDVVNEAIFRIGVLPRLPPGARIALVSSLRREDVQRTLVQYAPSVMHVLNETSGPVLVVPRASQLLCEADS